MASNLILDYISFRSELAKKYGESSVILMMVGSFYEMYEINADNLENIKKVSQILNIHLTKRNKSDPDAPYMCGFPCYALSKHLSKLLINNYTVGIYEQFDIEGSTKKDRKLVKIYSPSTFIDEEIIENNNLATIIIDSYICPISNKLLYSGYFANIDLSTGRNQMFEIYDNKENNNIVEKELRKFLYSVDPCEIVFISDEKSKYIHSELVNEFNDKLIHFKEKISHYYDTCYQNSFLDKIFGKSDIISHVERIGLDKKGDLLGCYIHMLQFAYEHDSHIIKKIHYPLLLVNTEEMYMNNDCIFQLNLVTKGSHRYSSLLNVIDETCTKMGARLLKDRLLRPITNMNELQERYDKIEEIINTNNIDAFRNCLKQIIDIEKKYRRLILQKLNPYEFANMNGTFQNIINLLELCIPTFSIKTDIIKNFKEFYHDYTSVFDLEELSKYDLNNIKTSFFNSDINSTISSLNVKIIDINRIFESIAIKLGDMGNGRAKVRFVKTEKDNVVFTTTLNYWNEIKKTDGKIKVNYIGNKNNLVCAIDDFEVKMNKNIVKISCKLTDKLSNILDKNIEKMKALVKKEYFKKLNEYETKWGHTFSDIIKLISEIDVIINSAYVAKRYNYCKPVIHDQESSFISCKGIRHPIIERIQDDKLYITNDIELNADKNGILLYGINSSGKSSLLRSLGCNIVLAQIGMFTSAEEFHFQPYTKLLTKISTNDNLFKGQSTFIVEMQELKDILEKADNNSLILCDELTAGTETNSATGIVASSLVSLIQKNSNFMFTTHLHGVMKFPEITEESKIKIYHFKINIKSNNVEYQRKLEKGSGEHLYGIEIAASLGLDNEFVKRAYEFRARHDDDTIEILKNKRSRYNKKVIVDHCKICESKKDLQTHHIFEQKLSDENNLIYHFHKNARHNLLVLCKTCHQKIHEN